MNDADDHLAVRDVGIPSDEDDWARAAGWIVQGAAGITYYRERWPEFSAEQCRRFEIVIAEL